MKKLILAIPFFFLFIASIFSQLIVEENFEDYAAGDYIALNSSQWITWDNLPGTDQDAFVTNEQFASPDHALLIEGIDDARDVFLRFPEAYNSGRYQLSFKLYIVAGYGASFNIQQSRTPAVAWKCAGKFSIGGKISLRGEEEIENAGTYNHDEWMDIKIQIDLDADSAFVYIQEELLHSYRFSAGTGSANSGTGIKAFGGLNVYSNGGYFENNTTISQAAKFYVDDIVLEEWPINTSTSNVFTSPISLYPNPVSDVLFVDIAEPLNYEVQLYDPAGKLLLSAKKGAAIAVSSFPEGIYFVHIVDLETEQRKVERISIVK